MTDQSSPSKIIVRRARSPLKGTVRLRGDKSVSIRRALLTLWVEDDVILENYGSGEDCLTALLCLRALGKHVVQSGSTVTIHGTAGLIGVALNCRNSGTCARLLMGLLASREGMFRLYGDSSLSRRPMERVAAPLRMMGADIKLTDGCLPAEINGHSLQSIEFESMISSAQVKSAILLAAVHANGETRYREPFVSRDHTERLLGIETGAGNWISCDPDRINITAADLSGWIPADISSAAFLGTAAAIVPDSEIRMPGVLVNPLRIAWVEKLRDAGAVIEISNKRMLCGEPLADITVYGHLLRAFEITPAIVPGLIDEIPALAVAAACATGASLFSGLAELRVKESDRFDLITRNLQKMSATIKISSDGFEITGTDRLRGAYIETQDDHRIAMAFAIAGLAAAGDTHVDNADCAAVSYPEFWSDLKLLATESVYNVR